MVDLAQQWNGGFQPNRPRILIRYDTNSLEPTGKIENLSYILALPARELRTEVLKIQKEPTILDGNEIHIVRVRVGIYFLPLLPIPKAGLLPFEEKTLSPTNST